MISNRVIIEPRKMVGFQDVASVAVLLCVRPDFDEFKRRLSKSGNSDHVWGSTTIRGKIDDDREISVAGPVYGAPHAALILEQLIASGARYVFFLGWCGSISPSVVNGDLVIALSSFSEEGTSRHYPLPGKKITASPRLVGYLQDAMKDQNQPFQTGKIWTTDALYRETEEKVLKYQRKGVLAVEMEVAALYKVAHYRGIEMAGLLVVSDELSSLQWKPGFGGSKFRTGRKAAVNSIFGACRLAVSELLK